MKKLENVKIDTIVCYEVHVAKYIHGPSSQSKVTAKVGYRIGDWACGSVDVDDAGTVEEVQEAANSLIDAIESSFLNRVAESEEANEERINKQIKSLVTREI